MEEIKKADSVKVTAKEISGGRTHIQIFVNGKFFTERKSKRKIAYVTFRQARDLPTGEKVEHVTFHATEKPAYAVQNASLLGELVRKELYRTVIKL